MRNSTRRLLLCQSAAVAGIHHDRGTGPFPATIPVPATSRPGACSTSKARRKKPGTSISISSAKPPRLCRRRQFFGIFAKNHLGQVDQIIALLGASHTTEVRGKTVARCADGGCFAIARAGLAVRAVLLPHRRRTAREGALSGAGRDPDGDAATARRHGGAARNSPHVRPHPEAFVEALEPLQPRLYSIFFRSHNATPGKLSLTRRLRPLRGGKTQTPWSCPRPSLPNASTRATK